ncbi:small ribosomal subunit protein mS31-like [Littorina saxatilis]|uniref:small ribosomal subunit protein mS31-like n=1 Tax=Littorina saxatilis TaxID=31220 RepID=UPI0038B53D3E
MGCGKKTQFAVVCSWSGESTTVVTSVDNMIRQGIVRLQKATLSDITRAWLGIQPHCSVWHSTSLLSNAKKTRHESGQGSSSSSDSDSDPEKGGGGVDQKLKEAAERVARSVPDHGSTVQSDLLKQLQSVAKLSKDQANGTPSSGAASSKVSNLLSGMQIQKPSPKTRADDGDFMQGRQRGTDRPPRGQFVARRPPQQLHREKVKLFEGAALNIFTTTDTAQSSDVQETKTVERRGVSLWEKVEQEQLDMFRHVPPTNAFEEMIQWTKEGKLWQFPINNEQGLDKESKCGFHQHVFLEDQIQDFPHRGPIRHFMELVLVGLSKNPYLTVPQKHEHIDWFRQYFIEKQDILEEALGKDGLIRSAEAK